MFVRKKKNKNKFLRFKVTIRMNSIRYSIYFLVYRENLITLIKSSTNENAVIRSEKQRKRAWKIRKERNKVNAGRKEERKGKWVVRWV